MAEYLFERGLCLPSGTAMRDEDIGRVVSVILSCRERNNLSADYADFRRLKKGPRDGILFLILCNLRNLRINDLMSLREVIISEEMGW